MASFDLQKGWQLLRFPGLLISSQISSLLARKTLVLETECLLAYESSRKPPHSLSQFANIGMINSGIVTTPMCPPGTSSTCTFVIDVVRLVQASNWGGGGWGLRVIKGGWLMEW